MPKRLAILAFALLLPPFAQATTVGDMMAANLDVRFHSTVQPFVQTYCLGCHSGDKPKAELDLSTFSNLTTVTADYRRWNNILDRLKASEMPPAEAKAHPTPAQAKPVIAWIQTALAFEAARNAGDPGPVLARRLSNAEYDNTIRDLTGVDMRPTKEFPVDPANEAGFDNSGESLAMSPELVKKYIDAAQNVADHIVFKPEGLTFAPFTVVAEADRDNYAVHRVVNFYEQFGLKNADTVDYFRRMTVDYADYFLAAWRYQNRAALGQPNATLAEIATSANLSPKYLDKINTMLSANDPAVGPVAALQARWRSLPPPADGKVPEAATQGCGYMRDLIEGLRPLVAKKIENFPVRGSAIAAGSQSMVLWKDKQYAINRMNYAGNAQQLDMSGYGATDPALLVPATDEARAQYEDSFKQFCALFPDAFAVTERGRPFESPNNIASDLRGHRLLTAGFHSQMGFFRDDEPAMALLFDDKQQKELDKLWAELDFVSHVPIRQFKEFMWFERAEPPSVMMNPEFNFVRPEDGDATTEAKIKQVAEVYLAKAASNGVSEEGQQVVRDYFTMINANIRAFEQAQKTAEPSHLDSLLAFAERAYRRPLTAAEKADLLAFYHELRGQQVEHEDAIRTVVVSVLMSPNFCYHADLASANQVLKSGIEPLSDYELASRLSYFLWASMPDQELLSHAAAGDLHQPAVLRAQAKRMEQDPRISGLATEFAGNWLDFRRFEEHNAVDRGRFPEFTNDLREAMFQEPIRFFENVIQQDGSVLDFLYGNYTFVNPVLAQHYGMPAPAGGPDDWVRVDDAQKYQRGGLLPMAVFMTKNAPGLRTSPVKRGFWVVSRLLGEHIPAPPPNVPLLPSDESKLGELTLRETLARHHQDPTCASCHEKFDSFGLVFEGFGPVGEVRALDLGGHPVDTKAGFPDGTEETGVSGLRDYLHTKVQAEFVENLCRKLLSFALGRTLVPSDDLLVADMRNKLSTSGYHFDTMIDSIVTSPQFLHKRNPAQVAQN